MTVTILKDTKLQNMTFGEEENSPGISTGWAVLRNWRWFFLWCTGLQSLIILTSTCEAALSQWYSAACKQITLTDPIQHHPWHSQSANKFKLTTFLPKKASLWYCLPKYLRSHVDVLRQMFQKIGVSSIVQQKTLGYTFQKKAFGIAQFKIQKPS